MPSRPRGADCRARDGRRSGRVGPSGAHTLRAVLQALQEVHPALRVAAKWSAILNVGQRSIPRRRVRPRR
jgi:hypothetical protein